MKTINWFERKVWLQDLRLQVGEVVMVEGHLYRYGVERAKDGPQEHSLTPVEPRS